MCGIIGYIGDKQALPFITEGLRKESYRGYDSSGVVVFDRKDTYYIKSVGKLEQLEHILQGKNVSGTVGLGHNRWATHGNVTKKNAHPHSDCKQEIFVTHNGIIENYRELKEGLEKEGHVFASETDTEVLPHLIENYFSGNLEQAVRQALREVKGAYAIAVVAKQDPGKIVAARFSAPLVFSVNNQGGFVASDPAAIVPHATEMVFLDDGEVAIIKKDSYSVTDLNGKSRKKILTAISETAAESQKDGYAHFMLKEIFEHPESIRNAIKGRLVIGKGTVRLPELDAIEKKLRGVTSITIVACGGSSYAAKAGAYALEEYAGIPTRVFAGSEFRYLNSVFDKKTLYVFISQSGETADTLAALSEVKKLGGITLGIVNVAGSTMAREVAAAILTRSGPEVAVASTKTFTAQLACLFLLAVFLGRQRKLAAAEGKKITKELSRIPSLVATILEQAPAIQKIALNYKGYQNMSVIGRKYNYPIALEGALKLKEVAYIHGEGIEGGELKHGYLSLIGESFPTIAIAPLDSVHEKITSNIQQVRGRNGNVFAIATKGDTAMETIANNVFYIPKTLELFNPLLSTIPLHLFAYYSALERGCDIDKPRNLAKSVTVE